MVNPNKVKGTAFESSLRDYAHKLRLKAFRPAQAGKGDLGDVHIEGIVTVQAKDHATARYNEWLEDVEQQRKNSGLLFGVVVHKKRRAPVGDARVVMTYDTLLSMIDRLGKAERMVNTNPATAYAFAQLLEKVQP